MHVVGTAGHVDHGKSTLVHRLTGIDPDRFAEEKRRGLTIDLGFAWMRLPSGREVGIVDVPGHERFIRNMLAGAGGITACLFVVAANEGWMPQSGEHLAIVDLLGVRTGVVALTKADAVDAETLELAAVEAAEKLAPTSLRGAPVVPVSALEGQGLGDLAETLDSVLGAAPLPPDLGRPRLWVDRVFSIAGAGTVVTGTSAGGTFRVGDEVEISPEGRTARIRSIQSHKRPVESIGPGYRTALNLVGLDRRGARRGDAVVGRGAWRPTRAVDVELRVLADHRTGGTLELSGRGAHLMYTGAAETPVRVRPLDRARARTGEVLLARLELRDALPLARDDRLVLRDVGRIVTVAGGRILDPLPGPLAGGVSRHAAFLQRVRSVEPAAALSELVRAAGAVDSAEAALRSGARTLPPDVVALGGLLVSAARLAGLERDVERELTRHHEREPLAGGMTAEALRAAVGLEHDPFTVLIDSMERVVRDGPLVRLASHRVALAPDQEAERDRVLTTLTAAGLAPPPARALGLDPALARVMEKEGSVVRLGDFYVTGVVAADVRRRVRAAIAERGPMTVAEIRDLVGTSRKYAIPLCEWLDATGATRRRGDVRVLGPDPRP